MSEAAALLSPSLPATGENAWDELSPGGLTLIRWGVSDGRMSHVIVTPHLHDARTNAPILTLGNGFDGQIGWGGEGRFTLTLRHYWRNGGAAVEIDRRGERFRFLGGADDVVSGSWQPLARLPTQVDARFTPSDNELARASDAFWAKVAADRGAPLPGPWGTILFVLFLLACFAGIVALLTFAVGALG